MGYPISICGREGVWFEVEQEGRARIVIEGVKPEIDGGRFPTKRVIGEKVVVEADIFADGHDMITAILLYHVGCSES
jgi:starch synthase (maltosyl-transferring)